MVEIMQVDSCIAMDDAPYLPYPDSITTLMHDKRSHMEGMVLLMVRSIFFIQLRNYNSADLVMKLLGHPQASAAVLPI